jgi:hypothetical protein
MTTEIKERIVKYSKELRLPTFRGEFEVHASEAAKQEASYEEYLLGLMEKEYYTRVENRKKSQIRQAGFPQKHYLHDLQKELLPDNARQKLPLLERLDFIKEGRNVVLAGNPGTGKTHIATGLGIKACQHNYKVTAIDKVRRREVKHHEELKHSRYALLKNKENLTEQQRIKFEAISEANYEVSRAWQVRENFKDLFSSNLTSGFILYARWAANSIGKKIKEITKVVDIFNNHMRGVINALIFNFNNAMAERLNGKIQEIKTVGRGYRTFKNFRSAILFFHGGLSLYPLNYQ